ncbi:MAG: RNA-binding protein [Dehalococcoidia bacterium]
MNIYVGNLAYEVADDDLRTAFAEYGQVDTATVIMDRYSGRSRGFGFVEMPNDSEAQAAIDGVNGKDLKGRTVTANQARAR